MLIDQRETFIHTAVPHGQITYDKIKGFFEGKTLGDPVMELRHAPHIIYLHIVQRLEGLSFLSKSILGHQLCNSLLVNA